MKRGGHYLALCAGYQFHTLIGPYSEDAIANIAYGFDQAGDIEKDAQLICWKLPEHEAEMASWDGEEAAEAMAEVKRRDDEYCGECCRRDHSCVCPKAAEVAS